MIGIIKKWYRGKFPRKVPKGAPSKKQFEAMTLAERKNLRLNMGGKEVLVVERLKETAKKLPEMFTIVDGKKQKINHEKELVQTYLYCGFLAIYNYLKSVEDHERASQKKHEEAIKQALVKK